MLTLPGLHFLQCYPQAESLKYKLLGGLAVRRACYGVLRFIMESGAKGAEVGIRVLLRQAVNALFFGSWGRWMESDAYLVDDDAEHSRKLGHPSPQCSLTGPRCESF